MKKRTLQVALHAREPSVVKLTVSERVQLDRITPTPDGCVAERHDVLLQPGVNTITLAKGRYFFKTLSDANLQVVLGGVDATPIAYTKDGNGSPDGPKAVPNALGDDAPGEVPTLSVDTLSVAQQEGIQ